MKKWIEVEVEADVTDFTTQELREELIKREGTTSGVPTLGSEEHHPLHEIYYALKFGLTERATELVKAYVCDELGVVL
ncbi:hypothetical protein INH39_25410 [Massilia violaceinigra]|uniref:Uncharacterized protein n=1 Tax=Massilia violaceinigra TaxID=2045208 RepID=A0ABY4A3Y0_9BURK|nr:hypothetical protein [Massilia violaceinigra]UOD28749.1 hypothetical protein INH39_25410 [Massilia violaceinigra]